MQTFRKISPGTPLSSSSVPAIIQDVLQFGNFFVAEDSDLEFAHVAERETRWEIFRGRLLSAAHTREMAVFEEWNLSWLESGDCSGEPLISIRRNHSNGIIHVVRSLHCYVWESSGSSQNVIEGEEVKKWIPELVGTINPERFEDQESFHDELVSLIFSAVVGASRLPLTSEEAPHPLFTFGKLYYCYREHSSSEPIRSGSELIEKTRNESLSPREKTKRLEFLLHVTPETSLDDLITAYHENLIQTLTSVYNEVSLSPWTDLTDKALALLKLLEEHDSEGVMDFIARLLCQLGRHLTAYDLVTFHHRGANYPDALLLDLLLKHYLTLIEKAESCFQGDRTSSRLRRRALRQGYLLRRFHENHPVPDVPTSPGEATRVLPDTHPRVPEDQILNPHKRRRFLYENDSIENYLSDRCIRTLKSSFEDLRDLREWREMGLALFLDRPLGMAKRPAEPDQTLLLSHLAFSKSIAQKRLRYLSEHCPHWIEELNELPDVAPDVEGFPLENLGGTQKPGTVSALDAWQVSSDFLYLSTTASSINDFLQQYDYDWIQKQFNVGKPFLLLTLSDNKFCIMDSQLRKRVELKPIAGQGYVKRAGREYLAGGFQVLRVWESDGSTLKSHECDNVILLPTT